ncbi:unnamed protein product [Allacma fusca]|uniref:Uncharacterized protein n=1 Tax=Allacma fusca TaxID=39272 RepID=A0A8J2KIL9_9HEXA|nr:unnamed protein product [Allacma fusca]
MESIEPLEIHETPNSANGHKKEVTTDTSSSFDAKELNADSSLDALRNIPTQEDNVLNVVDNKLPALRASAFHTSGEDFKSGPTISDSSLASEVASMTS